MTLHAALIQKLLTTQSHLPRSAAATHHHYKPFLSGKHTSGTAVIDPDKTLVSLRSAVAFLSQLVRLRARLLFVNTNPLSDEIVTQMTDALSIRHDKSFRLGGFLTNSSSPKKFKSRHKKLVLGSVYPPDCVVIMDTDRKCSAINEAAKLGIPIVGLVDPGMPLETFRKITYPIPANDSVKFVYLFCNLVTKTVLHDRRLMAKEGNVVAGKEVEVEEDAETEIGEAARLTGKIKIDNTNEELSVVAYDDLAAPSEDVFVTKALLDTLLVLKINTKLGTRIGFDGPNSTIKISNGLTCLDVIATHIESLNSKYGCKIPLLMLNSADTHDWTRKVLEKHSDKSIHTILQDPHHPVIKDSLDTSFEGEQPVETQYPYNHVQALLSLKRSGKLDDLLSQGKECILILDADNLADAVDTNILNHMMVNDAEFCMEVSNTSLRQLKGKSQSEEKSGLMKTTKLWLNMEAVKSLLERSDIEENPPISKFFNNPIGVKVHQSRFVPLEATSDVLIFESDLYTCSEGLIARNPARRDPCNPSIELGLEFEKLDDFKRRFRSIPSIVELDSLMVTGDVWFGTDVTLKGRVSINARPGEKIMIPDGAVLQDQEINSQHDISDGFVQQ